jgi:hypothetical protein
LEKVLYPIVINGSTAAFIILFRRAFYRIIAAKKRNNLHPLAEALYGNSYIHKKLAGIHRHGLRFPVATNQAGDYGL